MSKFFSESIYIVPGAKRPFHNRKDAMYFCTDNHIDPRLMEKYDSNKEYKRYIELSEMQRKGLIHDLRRQVAYEIIPAAYETIHVKDKEVRQWLVYKSELDGVVLPTKKEAIEYCKEHGLPTKRISSITRVVAVYKNVCVEKNAVYTADFVYVQNNETVVEDVKSDYTRKEKDYVLRRKLMLHVHGIRIREN